MRVYLSSFLFHGSIVVLMPAPHCSDYIAVSLKSGGVNPPTFLRFFWLLGVACDSIWIWEWVFLFLQMLLRFGRDVLESIVEFGQYRHFNTIWSFSSWTRTSFHLTVSSLISFQQFFIVFAWQVFNSLVKMMIILLDTIVNVIIFFFQFVHF